MQGRLRGRAQGRARVTLLADRIRMGGDRYSTPTTPDHIRTGKTLAISVVDWGYTPGNSDSATRALPYRPLPDRLDNKTHGHG